MQPHLVRSQRSWHFANLQLKFRTVQRFIRRQVLTRLSRFKPVAECEFHLVVNLWIYDVQPARHLHPGETTISYMGDLEINKSQVVPDFGWACDGTCFSRHLIPKYSAFAEPDTPLTVDEYYITLTNVERNTPLPLQSQNLALRRVPRWSHQYTVPERWPSNDHGLV